MIHAHICPHCCQAITNDPIVRGDLLFELGGVTTWRGQSVPIKRSQALMLDAILKSSGPISRNALADAMGYGGTKDGCNFVNVQLHHIRKMMPGIPIYGSYGRGVEWIDQQEKAA